MSSAMKLSQQVGRLSLLSGGGSALVVRNVVRSVVTARGGTAIRSNISNEVSSATSGGTSYGPTSFSSLASAVTSKPTSTASTSSSTITVNSHTLDYSRIFPGIPQHLIPTRVLPILLKDTYKGLRPSVIRKRIEKLKTYHGKQNNIRGSPWKLNLVCHLAAGLPVVEALHQLKFCEKAKAPLVAQVIQRTANLASIRDGLTLNQLEVATCFSTHGSPVKRIRFMAKGRHGKVRREFAHFNVTLREIDFDLKLVQSKTVNEMRRWLLHKAVVVQEVEQRQAEAKEMEELERKAQEIAEKKKNKNQEEKK